MTFSTLSIQPGFRPGRRFLTGGGQAERRFADFVVDGRSLLSLIGDDYVSCFVSGWAEMNRHSLAVLLTASGNQSVPIYVCPECFDVGCGAITTIVKRHEDTYSWGQLMYENPACDDVPAYKDMKDEVAQRNLGPFRFKADDYERVLREASRI